MITDTSKRAQVCRHLLTWALALVAAGLVGSFATASAATPYGELGHFGEAGTGKGQFNLTEADGETDAIGVDQATDDVYVVDGPTKNEFRLQKFELQSGKWTAVAEHKFKPGLPRQAGVEGVAVDQADGRVYVLALETRGENAKADPEVDAAGSLWAFSTSTLEPAEGTTAGLLAGPEVLQGDSTTAGVPLLEPRGIAVDPTTHDVIIMAYEDSVGEDENLRVVLQRVKSTGTLGARWVDETNFFGANGEEPEPTSPVISSTGKIYVADNELPSAIGATEQIDEIPSNFALHEAPKVLAAFESEGLLTFPGIPSPLQGAGLALGPEGDFYAYAQVLRQEGAGFHEPAVLLLNSSGEEIGWTGGENQPKEGTHVACAISFRGHPVIAAGSGGDVFVFDNNPTSPDVVEFGPGGSGCPTASLSTPSESVNGEPVSGAVSEGAKVKFASTVTQADALSVEWQFENVSTKAVEKVAGPAGELEHPELIHAFTAGGEYRVKELVGSDDLASPELTAETTITIQAQAPTAQFSATSPVTVGESTHFDAKASSGNGAPITSYVWNFGDGSAEVSSSESAVDHTYAATGVYTVTLTVHNSVGSGQLTRQVEVVAASSGGGTTTPTTTTPPATTPPATTPTPPPSLTYKASIAGASQVSRKGVATVKVACQGQSSCTGTVTLATASAVAAGAGKAVLTLGSASFSAAAGKSVTVTIHLSARARAYLAKVHSLKVRVTIRAKDESGTEHTTAAVVTLRLSEH